MKGNCKLDGLRRVFHLSFFLLAGGLMDTSQSNSAAKKSIFLVRFSSYHELLQYFNYISPTMVSVAY